ncbi:MAG TPA: hypothetical protein VLX44_13600 [Xanthobacteraceae bacterium]|nr:hypothetical protein [Xanthobacteraceae bacterium]
MFGSTATTYERIVDTMIELAHAAATHRIVVAGPQSAQVLGDLHRRGYVRSTTVRAARVSRGQHEVALVAWHGPPSRALEATLVQLVPFLSASGVLVVWVGLRDPLLNQQLRKTLARLGFRIESGTGCGNGIAVAARRLDSIPAAVAA